MVFRNPSDWTPTSAGAMVWLLRSILPRIQANSAKPAGGHCMHSLLVLLGTPKYHSLPLRQKEDGWDGFKNDSFDTKICCLLPKKLRSTGLRMQRIETDMISLSHTAYFWYRVPGIIPGRGLQRQTEGGKSRDETLDETRSLHWLE